MEVTRDLAPAFRPITVRFVIEGEGELGRVLADFAEIGEGNCSTKRGTTWADTDDLCEDIANQLSNYLED